MNDTHLTRLADSIAAEAHKHQRRKWSDDPYIVHPRRVRAKVASRPGSTEIDEAAALLHDVVEDTEIDADKLAELLVKDGMIDADVAGEVMGLVMELTQPYTDDEVKHMSRAEKRELDWAKLRNVSDRAKRLKLCDRIDNIGGSPMPSGMLRKYLPESRVIHEICSPADPELGQELMEIIVRLEKGR